jgi:hypothetical protein
MFGMLRRLIMSGDIKGLLDGSRRALRELSDNGAFADAVENQRRGDMGLDADFTTASDYLRNRGVDPSGLPTGYVGPNGPRKWPYARDYSASIPMPRSTMEGSLYPPRRFQLPDSGRYPQGGGFMNPNTPPGLEQMRGGAGWAQAPSPIVAPYEGMQVWPQFADPFGDMYPGSRTFPEWMGRGRPPLPSLGYGDPEVAPFMPALSNWYADLPRGFGGYGSPRYGDNVPRAFWERPYDNPPPF